MKILVSGALAYDKIMDYAGRFSDHMLPEKMHALSVSFVTENISEHFGGTAGNIAYDLTLLGERPLVLSSAGHDFGPYRDWLQSAGADLSLVRIIPDKPTMFVSILTDQDKNQIATVYLGTMSETSLASADALPTGLGALAIVSPGNSEDMRRLPQLYREKNIPFIFDPGQQLTSLTKEDLENGVQGAKALISNDYELEMIIKKTGWSEEDILKRTEMLVTTLGEKGSRIRTTATGAVAAHTYDIPVAVVGAVLDPTGAGDAYRAGFIKGLIEEWPLEVAGRFASVISAYAIEALGPQGHRFTLSDARARYAKNFGVELPS